MKMRICLIAGVIILLVVIIGIPLSETHRINDSSDCCQENVGRSLFLYLMGLYLVCDVIAICGGWLFYL